MALLGDVRGLLGAVEVAPRAARGGQGVRTRSAALQTDRTRQAPPKPLLGRQEALLVRRPRLGAEDLLEFPPRLERVRHRRRGLLGLGALAVGAAAAAWQSKARSLVVQDLVDQSLCVLPLFIPRPQCAAASRRPEAHRRVLGGVGITAAGGRQLAARCGSRWGPHAHLGCGLPDGHPPRARGHCRRRLRIWPSQVRRDSRGRRLRVLRRLFEEGLRQGNERVEPGCPDEPQPSFPMRPHLEGPEPALAHADHPGDALDRLSVGAGCATELDQAPHLRIVLQSLAALKLRSHYGRKECVELGGARTTAGIPWPGAGVNRRRRPWQSGAALLAVIGINLGTPSAQPVRLDDEQVLRAAVGRHVEVDDGDIALLDLHGCADLLPTHGATPLVGDRSSVADLVEHHGDVLGAQVQLAGVRQAEHVALGDQVVVVRVGAMREGPDGHRINTGLRLQLPHTDGSEPLAGLVVYPGLVHAVNLVQQLVRHPEVVRLRLLRQAVHVLVRSPVRVVLLRGGLTERALRKRPQLMHLLLRAGAEGVRKHDDDGCLSRGVRAKGDTSEAEVVVQQVRPLTPARRSVVDQHMKDDLLGRSHAEGHVLAALLPVVAECREALLRRGAVGADVPASVDGPHVVEVPLARAGHGLRLHHRGQGLRAPKVRDAVHERHDPLRRLRGEAGERVGEDIATVARLPPGDLLGVLRRIAPHHIHLGEHRPG
mmetsp:Transcript_100373/g.289873  ORF Transcript_100373/g.289873 Transcript_100373/m.289873 type:complete len:712 (-) Transcript_100373:43-2178(-)